MKSFFAVTALLLALAVFLHACESKQADDAADGTERLTDELTETDTGYSDTDEPADSVSPTDPDEDAVDDFIDEYFGDYGDGGEYEFKEEVGGKPVVEYGVVTEDGEPLIYYPDDPKAPTVYTPDPTAAEDPSEPEPAEPDTGSTEPADEPTEPAADSDSEPVAPKDEYSYAVSAIDDYTADVKYVCEVELSDGSVSKYVYKYRVSKTGDDYSATYTDKGAEKTSVFCATEGTMTTDGVSKEATLADFYRFCSMIEPIPLSLYYYERSEAGTDVSAHLNGDSYRSLLLNSSPLFTGFEAYEGITMGSLYFNGHIDAHGVYTASEAAFDMSLEDSILGLMLFRVSVEVDYVY